MSLYFFKYINVDPTRKNLRKEPSAILKRGCISYHKIVPEMSDIDNMTKQFSQINAVDFSQIDIDIKINKLSLIHAKEYSANLEQFPNGNTLYAISIGKETSA